MFGWKDIMAHGCHFYHLTVENSKMTFIDHGIFFYIDIIFLLDIFEKIHWNNDIRKRKIKINKYKTEEKIELINRQMETVKKI